MGASKWEGGREEGRRRLCCCCIPFALMPSSLSPIPPSPSSSSSSTTHEQQNPPPSSTFRRKEGRTSAAHLLQNFSRSPSTYVTIKTKSGPSGVPFGPGSGARGRPGGEAARLRPQPGSQLTGQPPSGSFPRRPGSLSAYQMCCALVGTWGSLLPSLPFFHCCCRRLHWQLTGTGGAFPSYVCAWRLGHWEWRWWWWWDCGQVDELGLAAP